MNLYRVVWSPEGREIARVEARTARSAIRKAPYPYRRYLGEMYAELVPGTCAHSTACRDSGCDDCERFYGPKVGR